MDAEEEMNGRKLAEKMNEGMGERESVREREREKARASVSGGRVSSVSRREGPPLHVVCHHLRVGTNPPPSPPLTMLLTFLTTISR